MEGASLIGGGIREYNALALGLEYAIRTEMMWGITVHFG